MARGMTASKLIRSIKRKSMIPEDQDTFDNQDFLEMINEEIQTSALPHLLTVHEEYLVYYVDVPFVEGQQSYRIPARSVGNRLRDLHFVDAEGDIIREAARISLEEIPEYKYSNSSTYTGLFYVQNNKVVLIGSAPQSNSFLRMYFYLSPSEVVNESDTAVISAIDRVNGVISLSTFPSNFSTSTQFDFVSSKNPNNLVSFDVDVTSTDNVTKTITLPAANISDDLEVGDYACLPEQTPVPQLPSELHSTLAQRVAISCLEALSDTEGLNLAQRKLMESERHTWDLVDNRVEGANQKMSNRHGTLAQASTSRLYNKTGINQ